MIARNALAAVLSGLLLATSPSLEAAAKPDIPGIVVPDLPADVAQALRSQRRMALVIGNGEYADSPLLKPPRDARSIAAALDYLGFEVTLHTNLGGEAMTRAVDAFADRLRASGALGLFFYSGHGVETPDGVGYLIPVDLSTAADAAALPYRAMPLGYVLGRMEGARDGIDILLIDACRNSRWVRSFRGPSGTGGTLRPMEAGKRSLVGFSTSTGQPASEGGASAPHSPFTQHLLSAIFQPGLPLRTVLDRVQDEVRAETEDLQIPAYRSTLGRTEVYFIPPSPPPPPSPAPLPPDQTAWTTIKDSRQAEDFRAFATLFPDSALAPAALERATALGSAVPAPLVPGTVFRDCPDCPELVVIPAGSFRMGCTDASKDCDGDEMKVRQVTVTAFALGKTEVTFDEWDACVADGGCSHQPDDAGWGRGTRPVINVSWDDVQNYYVPWLNLKTGQTYRLPTEAEWEYAARAGTQTAYSWDNAIGSGNANCNGCGSQWDTKQTAPVGSFSANAWGLKDMHGNVKEWVQDCWHDSYLEAPTNSSEWKGEAGCRRVDRGGSWGNLPRYLRAAFRNSDTPGSRSYLRGFRLARTLP